jgi:hypothetical protein
MKKITLLFIVCFCTFVAASGKSQTPIPAAPGTYQFRCTDIKKPLDVFTTDILFFIETHRDSLADKTFWVGANMKVKIFSYSVINAPGFVPVSSEPVFEKLSPDIYNEPENYFMEEVK